MEQKAFLVLENKMIFEGKAFGYMGESTGEVVFTTSMTGYLETLTDPSYYGQIVVQTFPLMGNYGVIPSDFESKHPYLKAYIVREWCQDPSNFRCEGNLDTFLMDKGIVGLYGIDTRALTRIVREYGVMNGKIVTAPNITPELMEEIRGYRVINAVENTTCKEKETYPAEGSEAEARHVVLMDFGAKRSIRRELCKRGCRVTVVPAHTTAEEILSLNPDGLMLSNGPGDPIDNLSIAEELKKLEKAQIPTFGICLGHQLLALSQGGKTEKLKYGHRGANQPAVCLETGRIYITSQNHGYAVVSESLPDSARVTFVNGNDSTCEGIQYKNMPAFSVQFHPEAAAGPLDTGFLFDQFIQMIDKEGK